MNLKRLALGLLAAVVVSASSPADAQIAAQGVSSVPMNGTSLTLTINVPAGTLGGDLMLAGIAIRPSNATVTAPGGWTLVKRENNNNTNSSSLLIFRRVATSAEPANYTWSFNTSTGSAGGIVTYSGVDTTNPINVEASTDTGNNQTTTFTAPSVTTTVANTMVVTHHQWSSSGTLSTPGGFTEAFDVASSAPNAVGITIAQRYRIQAAAGATGTSTSNGTGQSDVGNMDTLALRPLVCGTTTNVAYAAATAQNGQAVIYWSSPNAVVVLQKTTAFAGETPVNGRNYVAGNAVGGATVAFVGTAANFRRTGLTNGTTYYYRIFPYTTGPGPCYATGAGSDLTARPVNTATTNEEWSYMLAGGSALKAPTTGYGTVYFSSNAGRMISLDSATGEQSWVPPTTTAPAQGYIVWTSVSDLGTPLMFGGDQSGRVYAFDTTTGTTAAPGWQVAVAGADAVQAGITIQIRDYSDAAFAAAFPGTYDVVIAATSNTTGAFTTNNKVVAMNSDTGAVLWTFNPCTPTCAYAVDQIVGQPWVDHSRNWLYVTSRAGSAGTQPSFWILDSRNGAVVASFALGHISTAVMQDQAPGGNTLWVGNENGNLYAINLATPVPSLKWTAPLALGAAARVRGFVWEDWYTPGRIYFSTANGTVRCFQDPGVGGTPNATTRCSGWSAVSTAVAGATTGALLDNRLYVGSWTGAQGRIVAIDTATGVAGTPFVVGDGTRQVGDLSTETWNELFIGTTEGKVFKITLPLP